jgi:hypothetical protein
VSGAIIVLKPYEPGYTPDWNELCYIDLEENDAIAELVRQISQVQQAELFREADEIVDHLQFLRHHRQPERPTARCIFPHL